MAAEEDQDSRDVVAVGLDDQLLILRTRLDHVTAGADPSPDELLLVADLETAYEELRAADEEVRAQQAEIAELLAGQQLLRWHQERLLASLPVATFTCDGRGMVRSANVAASVLTGRSISQLVGRPVLNLFDLHDRAEMRHLVLGQDGHHETFHRRAGLRGLDGVSRQVEVTASVLTGVMPETTWMLFEVPVEGATVDDPRLEHLPALLARLAALPSQNPDPQALLLEAAELCAQALGEGVELSLLLGPPLEPAATVSTDRLAQQLDGAQIAAGEGPAVTAFTTGRPASSVDVRRDPRWPRLARAVSLEISGVLAVPLRDGDQLTGALTLCGRPGKPVDALAPRALLLAATLSGMLRELDLLAQLQELAHNMEQALASRSLIDQAKGIVMADRGCTADQAFSHLAELSSSRQLKVRDVARMLVEQRSGGAA